MSQPVTTARLEKALAAAARVVVLHGDAYLPIMERLEEELDAARRKGGGAERARRILASMGSPASL